FVSVSSICALADDPARFFFNDTPTTAISTLSLHDALPIWYASSVTPGFLMSLAIGAQLEVSRASSGSSFASSRWVSSDGLTRTRSEEHTSELQSQSNLVCRLLLEKKNNRTAQHRSTPHSQS